MIISLIIYGTVGLVLDQIMETETAQRAIYGADERVQRGILSLFIMIIAWPLVLALIAWNWGSNR